MISVSSDMTGTVPSSDQSVAPPQPKASMTVNSSCQGVSPKNLLAWQEKRKGYSNLFYSHFINDSRIHAISKDAERLAVFCVPACFWEGG